MHKLYSYGPRGEVRFTCQVCGRVVHRHYERRRRRFEVCSERCHAIAVNAANRVTRHAFMQHRCAVCDQPFVNRRTAKFCSNACRQEAYRQRRRDIANVEAAGA
jgi:endogenous inhibitor of DNA gyrase (YacG/DUF329 family)